MSARDHPNDPSSVLMTDGSSSFPSLEQPEERDEIKEVQKTTQRATNRVRIWRIIVIAALIATATAVTVTTHRFLVDEQESNFRVAFEQFSRTVADAALEQQKAIRDGYRSVSNSITASAQSSNASWPFFTLPLFETYANNFFVQSRAELLTVFNRVDHDQRAAYENYTLQEVDKWMREGHMLKHGSLDMYDDVDEPHFHPYVTRPSPDGFIPEEDKEEYFVGWSNSPPPRNTGLINWNLASIGAYSDALDAAVQLKYEAVSTAVRPYSVAVGIVFTPEEHGTFHSQLLNDQLEHPHSFMFYPIHEKVDDTDSRVVGTLGGGVAWDASLKDLLPDSVVGIHAIIKNNCNQSFTYRVDGPDAIFLGPEDLHEQKFDDMKVEVNLALHANEDFVSTPGHCMFKLEIYPTSEFQDSYHSSTPKIFAIVLAATFLGVIIVFIVYDVMVQARNNKIVQNAAQTNAIVTSMLPSHLRDRIVNQKNLPHQESSAKRLKGRLTNGSQDKDYDCDRESQPLADLFLETTIAFMDIAGFTAWSSSRDPTSVFTLLETVYQEFDKIAVQRRVFKVETVGDCYVAVAGLPDPRKDHAVAMARFASDCLSSFNIMVKQLEVKLGPDTGEMGLRIGMHSGPVTAGILRGERSRFQLFGDTMNTTARIESTSTRGRIQVSTVTADLLKEGGKEAWLTPREDMVVTKGLGSLRTHWLNLHGKGHTASTSGSSLAGSKDLTGVDELLGANDRAGRLIDWNLEMMLPLLKRVVARRNARQKTSRMSSKKLSMRTDSSKKGNNFLDEVQEIIELPDFCGVAARAEQHVDEFELSSAVVNQLRDYIKCVSLMYRPNAFHNFEHASHVVMSIFKMLGRIVAPTDLDHEGADDGKVAASLHDHTYGITSDPLTQFACVFSGLIHDVDHSGVPNNQVIDENPFLGELYKNRSVAEQNSLDLSWDLLMETRFKDLHTAICGTPSELKRFRELVVNSVMATDIADKELKNLRNARWEKAFKKVEVEENQRDIVNRKATIVIEHLIQASDISHTMQHWHVYRKWNERLFEEMYTAYKSGRAENNPVDFWAKGEIGFFDFYIIPLAKKLKECSVFGVSSGEYLDYAIKNRNEWEAQGPDVVAEMVRKFGTADDTDCAGTEIEIDLFTNEVDC